MKTYIGVDISKPRLDVNWQGKAIDFENNPGGIKKLIAKLQKLNERNELTSVVLEASGGYERKLVHACHEYQLPVHVAHANKVRSFAKSKGILAKTDKLDASVLSDYGLLMNVESDQCIFRSKPPTDSVFIRPPIPFDTAQAFRCFPPMKMDRYCSAIVHSELFAAKVKPGNVVALDLINKGAKTMSKERLTMRQIKEVLRLKHGLGLSQRAISDSTGVSRSTIRDYLLRAKAADLGWPLPEEIDNEQLNGLLFPMRGEEISQPRSEPDWDQTHKELKRKGVTLQLLWEEYKREHPAGYQYSWYAHRYRQWSKTKDVWMVQSHDAGDKVFVDYSGLTFPIWKTNLQEIDFYSEIFVSVLGASDLIFCLATQSQTVEDWIHAHNKMFAYYGGASFLIVPDNLRSGVTKAHRYEALCNRTYDEMAEHYACAIMPARSYKPKDKAKVEKSVQSVQRRILSPLRDKQFTSLTQYNEAMIPLLETLNEKPFQKLPYSRRTLFNKVEKNALQPLPTTPYQLARWHQETVNGGYHVQANQHYYSVPYGYVRKKIDIRVSTSSVECFYQEKRAL